MNARILLALAILTAVPGASLADTWQYHRDSIGPTGVHVLSVGQTGSASCDDGFGGEVNPLIDCGTGGMSAIIVVAGLEDSQDSHFAMGTCSVHFPVAQPLVLTTYTFTCGTDRDDDTLVTNADAVASDPDGYDDDFVSASLSPPEDLEIDFCFRRDTAAAGHDWDTWTVFILANVPGVTDPGTYSVYLEATPTLGCDEVDVSGHCHASYYGGHATPAPPPGKGPKSSGLFLADALRC